MARKTRRSAVTLGRDGVVRYKGKAAGTWRQLGQHDEHDGELAPYYVVATLDAGEVICEPKYRVATEVELAIRRRSLPDQTERLAAVERYLKAVAACAPAGSSVERGEGYHDGWKVVVTPAAYRVASARWASVTCGDVRVVVNAAFSEGGLYDPAGVCVSGHTLYRSTGGAWLCFSRPGIEDSFYARHGEPAVQVVAAQLERAEAARLRAGQNEGKLVAVPGAPCCVHVDQLPGIRARLAEGRVHSFHPHGFGVGLHVSSRPIRGYEKNAAVARALGVPVAYTCLFDAD